MKSNPLSNAERAVAYSRLYTLLSSLYLHGLTHDNLEPVRLMPPLAAALPEQIDLDAAAVDHQHLFGFNVFPSESAFLDPSGLLGGSISDSLILDYRQSGYQPRLLSEGADHIGTELEFLAYLNRSESNAWTEENADYASRLQENIRGFIDDHIFRWLAPFLLAVRHQQDRFFGQLVDLTLESINQQRSELGHLELRAINLPETQPGTEKSFGDMKHITAHLLTPLLCGIFVSRDDIGRLSRELSLPRGFGQRRHMIENLFQSAVTYERIANLISSLQRMLLSWETGYRELAIQAGPTLQVSEWTSKAKETSDLLGRLADEPFR